MPDGALGGVLMLTAATAAIAAGIALVLHAGDLWALLRRALQALAPSPPVPAAVPMQQLAVDLRRLRAQAQHREGEPMARHRGVVAAYDSALTDACRALTVDTCLTDLPEGVDRDAERLRVEAAVERAGLALRLPPPG